MRFDQEYIQSIYLPSMKEYPQDHDWACKEIIRRANQTNKISVLDYGCGDAKYTKAFNKMGVKCVGYEVNKDFIEADPSIRHVNDIDPADKYDLSICLGVLQYCDLAQKSNVLKYLTSHCKLSWVETLTSEETPYENDKWNAILKPASWYMDLFESLNIKVQQARPVYYKYAWLLSA